VGGLPHRLTPDAGTCPLPSGSIMTDETEAPSPPSPPRADKPRFLTRVTFAALQLPPAVLQGLADAGFTHCSPIQAQTLPVSLTGRDIAGQAQTGTGKTAAFLLTVFTRLLESSDRDPDKPAALIVAPTRELAAQILEDAHMLGAHTGLRFTQVVGGIDYQKQAEQLRSGTDVVIGTPGRIIDFQKQGVFKTDAVRVVVIDEADRLLDLGFADDMRYILRKLPHYDKRQSMLFSATLSYRVMELTYEYMNLPEFIAVTPEEVTVEGIEQSLFHVGSEAKLPLLLGLLTREQWSRMLIFVNTKSGVEWLTRKLVANGWPAEGITGDLPQRTRFQLMERFKNGNVRILVATDVASRGIHVEDISHVINYDLPQDPENYVHRIGRTARAGKTGRAISLACENYVFHLEPLEKMLGAKLPVVWHDESWLVADQGGPSEKRREGRKGPSRPVKSREPRGDASRREAGRRDHARPERPRREGTEREKPAPEVPRREAPIARGHGYFPGTFFGFAPPNARPEPAPAAPDAPGAASTPAAAAQVATEGLEVSAAPEAESAAGAAKPKRRRRRRPRHRRPGSAPGAEAESADTAPA
jgi:ATP-dependent RNA helicase RhlB